MTDDNNKPDVGDPAPDFTLPTHSEGELNLAWHQGRKNVMLAFYPGDWTPVCSVQIPGYQLMYETFERHACQPFGISVDSVPCHIAWVKSLGGLYFPLMSDYYPHGEVSRQYGVFDSHGWADRAVFLIDKKGIIRFVDRVPDGGLPDNDALVNALAGLDVSD